MRFIFSPDAVKVTIGFIKGRLHLEQLIGVAATLHLSPVQLGLETLDLVLPSGDNLIKVARLLLHFLAMHRASASSTATTASSISASNFAFSLSSDIAFPLRLLMQPSPSTRIDRKSFFFVLLPPHL